MRRLLLTAALVAAFFVPASALAMPQCNTRDSVLRQLADKYGEVPVALGVTHNGGLIEVFAAPNGKTWSIIVTSPQGMSCLVAAGSGWPPIDLAAPDPEAEWPGSAGIQPRRHRASALSVHSTGSV